MGRPGEGRGRGVTLDDVVLFLLSLQLQSRYEQELVQHAKAVQSLTEVKEEVCGRVCTCV